MIDGRGCSYCSFSCNRLFVTKLRFLPCRGALRKRLYFKRRAKREITANVAGPRRVVAVDWLAPKSRDLD